MFVIYLRAEIVASFMQESWIVAFFMQESWILASFMQGSLIFVFFHFGSGCRGDGVGFKVPRLELKFGGFEIPFTFPMDLLVSLEGGWEGRIRDILCRFAEHTKRCETSTPMEYVDGRRRSRMRK